MNHSKPKNTETSEKIRAHVLAKCQDVQCLKCLTVFCATFNAIYSISDPEFVQCKFQAWPILLLPTSATHLSVWGYWRGGGPRMVHPEFTPFRPFVTLVLFRYSDLVQMTCMSSAMNLALVSVFLLLPKQNQLAVYYSLDWNERAALGTTWVQPPTMALYRLHHDASRNASMHHQVDTKPELQNPRIMCRRCHEDWRLCCLQVRHHIFQTVDVNISRHIFTLSDNETWRMHYAISAVSYYSIATSSTVCIILCIVIYILHHTLFHYVWWPKWCFTTIQKTGRRVSWVNPKLPHLRSGWCLHITNSINVKTEMTCKLM